ncbi:gamma-glutamyl cyclotransferase domain-containing protein [Acrasis kona]|uniref:gamma-glutamylcyclotransferase n=1 Tax=Acrasis kona TaxID=1008807 RepID=A0AAW2Z5I6_9EUKA
MTSENVWYLAYGSNMNSKVFKGRRQIKPMQSMAARVPGWTLDFHLPSMPYFEPGMACVHRIEEGEDAQELHGVLYEVTADDYAHIRRTEGGGYKDTGYQDTDVECITYEGKKIHAKTLIRPSNHYQVENLLPSMRYITIIRDGAKEHGLSSEYLEYLNSLKHYVHNETWGKAIGRWIVLLMLLPFAIPFLLAMIASMFFKVTAPRLVYVYFMHFGKFSWLLHDLVLSRIFGSGKSNLGILSPIPIKKAAQKLFNK